MINDLIKLASDLDEKGLHEEANQLDNVIQKIAEDKKDEDKKDEDKKDEDKKDEE